MVGHIHPSLWTLITAMQHDLALAETAILQDARGQHTVKRQKRAAVQLEKRLESICRDRLSGSKTIEDTLRAVSHCIRLEH